ncbi:hypothetical protein MOJ79_01270 [Calidifontimicrobium sp. SYSU G02091]|uniref:hypothetical protein n=1 Tax=Calidifontimicrobium sp. SYSU G02091 TaxID=2926421 RepID=UPI001F53CB88|nr:hypothetical protein [Calidifontimicrobium sp. SYSU G02091]MCI1190469.1 hypothetical protein [Calidifontimicrobium sp. SYSU G02091]
MPVPPAAVEAVAQAAVSGAPTSVAEVPSQPADAEPMPRVAPLAPEAAGFEAAASPPGGAGPADGAGLAAAADELDLFVPRPLLTVPPRPQGDVVLDYPAAGPAFGRFTGVIALYIDEHGVVRHVQAEDDALPPALMQAAREAFVNLRFEPGRLDERVVRSRIRVEVLFESRPLVAPDNGGPIAAAPAGSP